MWCRKSCPWRANVDPDLLRQAIANLVKNAGEAIAEDGLVKLSAAGGEYLEIQVEDNGCGIEQSGLGGSSSPTTRPNLPAPGWA
jgi:signal transduction histidine kinase